MDICSIPASELVDSIKIMSSTPLISCSNGAATASATTCALAPGYIADTTTCGGATSGYISMGKVRIATIPTKTIITEMTDENNGRSIKNLNIETPFTQLSPQQHYQPPHSLHEPAHHQTVIHDHSRLDFHRHSSRLRPVADH